MPYLPASAVLTPAERRAVRACVAVLARRGYPLFLELEAIPGRPAAVRYDRVETGPDEFTDDPALMPACDFRLADPFRPPRRARRP